MTDALLAAIPGRIAAASRRPSSLGSAPSDTISLAMGEPFAVTSASIREAAIESLHRGRTKYTELTGSPPLREAVADAVSREVHRSVSAREVVVTHGGSAGLAATILATVRPGDHVILQDPTYSLYVDHLAMIGAEPVWLPAGAGGRIDMQALDAVAANARMLVLCNPSNPTGYVADLADMKAIEKVMVRHPHLLLVADEAYSSIVFDGREFVSALTLDEIRERVIVVRTFSKAYAMTGWRLGYTVAAPATAAAINLVHRTINGSLNTFVQDAGIRAVKSSEAERMKMVDEYQTRRDLVARALDDLPRVSLIVPGGAFYAFPRIDSALTSDQLVAQFAAEGLLLRSGSEFGPSGEGHVRISFATDTTTLAAGLDRFRETVARLA